MIYDCFSFFDELTILEIRLNVLKDAVDRFVLVEAVRKHSGASKPLYFEINKERFKPFLDRIIHIVVEDEPELPDDCPRLTAAWAYENHQRNAILRGLKDLRDDDTILISDLDEIPDPELVRRHAADPGVTVFEQMMSYYFFNYVRMDAPRWQGTKMLTGRVFRDGATYAGMKRHIPMPEFANRGPTPTRVRFLKPTRKLRGGWHFSYFGGAEKIKEKLLSIADHVADASADVPLADIRRRIAEGRDPLDRGGRFCAVPFDRRFPAFLLDNREHYRDGILTCRGLSSRDRILFLVLPLKSALVRRAASLVPNGLKPFVHALYCKCVKNPIPLMRDQLSEKKENS